MGGHAARRRAWQGLNSPPLASPGQASSRAVPSPRRPLLHPHCLHAALQPPMWPAWPEPAPLTLHGQVRRGRGRASQAVAGDAGILPRVLRLHPEDNQGPVDQDPHPQLQITAGTQNTGHNGGGCWGRGAGVFHSTLGRHASESSARLRRGTGAVCTHTGLSMRDTWTGCPQPLPAPRAQGQPLLGSFTPRGPGWAPREGQALTSGSRHSRPASTRCR